MDGVCNACIQNMAAKAPTARDLAAIQLPFIMFPLVCSPEEGCMVVTAECDRGYVPANNVQGKGMMLCMSLQLEVRRAGGGKAIVGLHAIQGSMMLRRRAQEYGRHGVA